MWLPMTLTHWFLIFGGLSIIAIAIDGIRRTISRPSPLSIKLDETLQNLPVDDYRSELPNGGARLVTNNDSTETSPQAKLTSAFTAPLKPNTSHIDTSTELSVTNSVEISETPTTLELLDTEEAFQQAQDDLDTNDELLDTEILVEEEILAAEALVDEEELINAEITVEEIAELEASEEVFELEDTALALEDESEVSPQFMDEIQDEIQDEIESRFESHLEAESQAESQAETQVEAPLAEMDIGEEPIAEDADSEFDLAAPDMDDEALLPQEENPLAAVFDPTRPVHEVVESHKMVQSDMFADLAIEDEVAETQAEWQAYSNIQQTATVDTTTKQESELELELEQPNMVAEPTSSHGIAETAELAGVEPEESLDEIALQQETEEQLGADEDLSQTDIVADDEEDSILAYQAESAADDILLTDTGLDDDQDETEDTLGARLAKVTSFSFGKMLLENRRKQVEEDKAFAEQDQAEGSVVAGIDQVLSIIVVANEPQGFYGEQLQGLAEACGMVHGTMDLFHRHEDSLLEGQTQFSMANMTESGSFDLHTMSNVHTAGVVFFMTLPSANDSIRAFDYMLETAQCLANNLGGELYDENRSVLRAQTVEHYRQRIREFERQRLARRAQGAN
jgi:cell division protein ZipA